MSVWLFACLLGIPVPHVLTCSHSRSSVLSCNCLLSSGIRFLRGGRKRKTMKLSRDLSNLVVFTNSVASQECLNEGETANKQTVPLPSWPQRQFCTPNACFSLGTPGDVLSFSETRAQSLVNHRADQFLAFNQRQLSRIYPSAYRIDSSNFNPQFYWNVGCQLGKTPFEVRHLYGGWLLMRTPLHCTPAHAHMLRFILCAPHHALHLHISRV